MLEIRDGEKERDLKFIEIAEKLALENLTEKTTGTGYEESGA